MEDGVIQLLFILFILFAAFLDFIARQKDRRRKMEEMDREDDGTDEIPWDQEVPREDDPLLSEEGTPSSSAEEGGRRTADTMVPSDFWEEILGGGKGTASPPAEEPSTGTQERGASARPDREAERGRKEETSPSAPTWGGEARPGSAREGAMLSKEGRDTPRGPKSPREGRSPGRVKESEAQEPRALSDRELLRTVQREEARKRSAAARKRRKPRDSTARPPEDWADLIRSGGPEALKKAVVYREVLGKPVAFRRSREGGWEGEE